MKSFGTLAYAEGQWRVECEPHVRLKLKRVFPKVSARAHGTITIHDTIEVARDLEWFIERYPLQCQNGASERLRFQSMLHRERESLVDELMHGRREARPFALALPPREYQRTAAELILATGGTVVADGVGLGKTCTGICVLTEPAALPALVVTLTHLPKQWESELRKFAPNLTTHIIQRGTPYDLVRPRKSDPNQIMLSGGTPDVFIVNYHKLAGWAETLAPLIRSVIYDEGQELRRPDSNKYAAAAHLSAHATYRTALTATPIYNYGDEMFTVCETIRPGALGSRDEFLEEWCTHRDMKGRARIANPEAFGAYLREAGLMIRRTADEVGRETPRCQNIPHYIDCDTKQLDAVKSSATELAKIILSQNPLGRGEKLRAAEEFSMLMRQATGIAKAPYVADFVRLLVESGERVLLYGWHRDVYRIWADRLADLKPVLFTGSETPRQKEDSKQRFLTGESHVMLMSLRAGAGIDGLQYACRTVVYGELDWSPGVHEQCTGRLDRDGQAFPVNAYYLLADHGSDPVVADVLGVKREQILGIRDPGRPLVERLQTDGGHITRLAESYLNTKGR